MSAETGKWIESAATANAAFQIACSEALERQGSALLMLILAGAGGSMAYAVSLIEKGSPLFLPAGMAGVSVWLFFVAGVLLLKVLWSREIFGPANDPSNLTPAFSMTIESAIRYELENRQKCIDSNRERNNSVGFWLNLCRLMAVLAPIAFFIPAALVVY